MPRVSVVCPGPSITSGNPALVVTIALFRYPRPVGLLTKGYIEHGYKGCKNRPYSRHGATSVVDWDAPKRASMCKKSHSYAGV